jgi:hypothetical protein
MLAGKIKCDFCTFVGDLEAAGNLKGTLQVPSGWVSIHPMITVHGLRGIDLKDPRYEELKEIKERVKEKVTSLHCCPGCCKDRNIFGINLMLPAAPEREVAPNPMKKDA